MITAFTKLYVQRASLCAVSGDILFRHGETYNRTCAFDITEHRALILYIPRQVGATQVALEIFSESADTCHVTLDAPWYDQQLSQDIYTVELSDLPVGLYFARVAIDSAAGRMYGYLHDRVLRITPDAPQPNIQLSVSEFAFDAPNSLYGGTIYHVFVDRFRKGGEVPLRDGAILNPDWDHGIPQFAPYNGAPLKNNMFFGGTLWGIIEKLPYIASLGVTALYLSPIFDSPSNHKYDTADYMKVDPMFGGDEALSALIQACKAYRIKIILDGVFNHTGADSLYFNKYARYPTVGAYQSKASPYYGWYDFQNYPDHYTCWWGIDILPRIHPDVPSCGEFFTGKSGVVRRYADMGVYGFRLDVADELSDRFITSIKTALQDERRGDTVLYGEVWEDASNKIAYDTRKTYFLGTELDGVMNYPIREGLISYFTKGQTDALAYALHEVTEHAPARVLHAQMNLLGTHDTERILTLLAGAPKGQRTNAELSVARMTEQERAYGRELLKMAYTVLATLPGVPAIFYGDEVGMEGYHDPFNRRPFPWGREDMELLAHFQKLGRIRKRHDVYKTGTFRLLSLTAHELIFVRLTPLQAYVTVVNRSNEKRTYTFSDKAINLLNRRSGTTLHVAPNSAAVFRTQRDGTMDAV